jgi:hypothetical protein
MVGILRAQGRWSDIKDLLHEMLGTYVRADTKPPEGRAMLICISDLAEVCTYLGFPDKALELQEQVIKGFTAALRPDHSFTLRSKQRLAMFFNLRNSLVKPKNYAKRS